jgi:ABC-type uncharacterized transport system permease subunit
VTSARRALPVLRTVALVAFAIFVIGLLFEATGFSMGGVFRGIWEGAISAPGALKNSLRWSIPLIVVGAGVLVSFRSGFFNVGAQGQVYAGSITAVAVLLASSSLPAPLMIALALLAGTVGGAAWSLGPGALRVFFGTDEVLTTLMMNFIGILLLEYVTSGPLRDVSGSGVEAATTTIAANYRITSATGVSVTIVVIAGIVVVGTWLLVGATRFGFQTDLVGRNPVMARWQGIDIGRVGLLAFAVTGATAGLAGCLEVIGPSGRAVSNYSPNLGFTAILVALVAGRSMFALVLAGLFFGGLQAASLYLPIVTSLPPSGIDSLNGFITLIITISALPLLRRRWRRVRASKPPPESAAVVRP